MRTGAGLRLLTVVSPVSAVAWGRVSAREACITSVLAGAQERWSGAGEGTSTANVPLEGPLGWHGLLPEGAGERWVSAWCPQSLRTAGRWGAVGGRNGGGPWR